MHHLKPPGALNQTSLLHSGCETLKPKALNPPVVSGSDLLRFRVFCRFRGESVLIFS